MNNLVSMRGSLMRTSPLVVARAPQPLMLLPAGDLPPHFAADGGDDALWTFGLPTDEELPSIASLIVQSFYGDADRQDAQGQEPAAVDAPADASVPVELHGFSPRLHARWRTATQGLQWRLGPRLAQQQWRQEQPADAQAFQEGMTTSRSGAIVGDLSVSLESSLVLAIQERATGALVACAELSMRPVDGRLPGEFAVPALFQLHSSEGLGAYVSNLAVLPAYRQRGLASKLLAACEWIAGSEWQQDALYLHLNMHNSAAVRLYSSFEPLPEYDAVCKPPDDPSASGVSAQQEAPVVLARRVQNRYYRKLLLRPRACRDANVNELGAHPCASTGHREPEPGASIADSRAL